MSFASQAEPRGTGAIAWRPARLEERQLAWIWGFLAACSLLLRPFWLAAAPLLPPCAFRALTGVPCLSCGTTRAAQALLDCQVISALAANPLAALAGLGFLAGGVVAPIWALFGLPLLSGRLASSRAFRIALVGALLADWAWVIARS